MRFHQGICAAALTCLLSIRNADAFLSDGMSAVEENKFNVTAAKLVPGTKVADLINTTTAAVVGLKNFTQGMILDKEAEIEEIEAALKADIWAAPKAVPAEPAVAASFAQAAAAADHTADEADKQAADCWDEAPKDSQHFSCDQQKSWGKCGESWMTSEGAPNIGWCAKTCGRC